MTEGKKDILEMDFGPLSIPQAIGITAQAITKCVDAEVIIDEGEYKAELEIDNDRVAELMEKLEGRVQDALDEKVAPIKEAELDALDEENVDWSDVVLLEDGMVANIKGAVYQKACNELVYSSDGPDESENTYCIKKFGHGMPTHEDDLGNERHV